MKTIKLISIAFAFAMLIGINATAEASLLTGPLTLGQLEAIVDNNPDYGPPPAASFPNGPTSIPSGESQDLIAMPGQFEGDNDVDYLLFVISFNEALSGTSPGSVDFDLTLYIDSTTLTDSATLLYTGTSGLNDDDFFTSAQIGFPDNIEGIGNGEVGGVKFPDALHGALLAELPDGTFPETVEAIIGEVGIDSSKLPLRVDVFSLIESEDNGILSNSNGSLRIVGNNPNSHALAVPEADTAIMLFLGTGLLGLFRFGRKRFFKK